MQFLLIFLLLSSAVFLLMWLINLIIPSLRRESFVYILFALLSIGGLAALYWLNPAPKPVATDVKNAVYKTQPGNTGAVVVDAGAIKLKTPAEAEKILGKPDAPAKPGGTDGKWVVKATGQQAPASQAMYKNGLVEVTYIENKAARIWLRPKTSYFYPADTAKIFTALGLKPGPQPVLKTENGADWYNNIPGIYNLHLNITGGTISEIGIVFEEKYI